MQMRIKRVRLYNFSSYAGEHELNLDTAGNKNVILIGGNNGAGKTSLFMAIKLALYGPQCFRFQDKNNQYTARIKGFINHNAFLSPDTRSFVELQISLPSGQRVSDYIIHREWRLLEKNLTEDYTVICDGIVLGEKYLDFFQNYLFTVIPPNIFDFFFFDGEEAGDFLSGNKRGQRLRDAVLTLSGYDTFRLIEKFCRSFVGSDLETEEFTQTVRDAETAHRKLEELDAFIEENVSRLERLRTELAEKKSEYKNLQAQFSRAGGLDSGERQKLDYELSVSEDIKSRTSQQIRGFVETLMPVFITRDTAFQAEEQLHNERIVRQYEAVKESLSPEAVLQILQNIGENELPQKEQFAERFSNGISDYLKPNLDTRSFVKIHDISEEQEQRINAITTNLRSFSVESMIAVCQERSDASKRYDQIMARLRGALPEMDVREYDSRIKSVSVSIEELEHSIKQREENGMRAEQDLKEQKALCDRLKRQIQQQARYQTAYVYTERIAAIMTDMIASLTNRKRRMIETLSLKIFSRIIRKENYIQLVELDRDFNVNIYKKQVYTTEELGSLLRNLGVDGLERRLGSAGINYAVMFLGLQSREELYAYLAKNSGEHQFSITGQEQFELYSRMDINQLSKGEKQVFALSLYWAIIKSSEQQIPFIIDTPFARIDTEHRAHISEIFFPEISDQVIVLSTDEEVVGSYYKALKPFIAREYLLEYDVSYHQTNIREGYFSGV